MEKFENEMADENKECQVRSLNEMRENVFKHISELERANRDVAVAMLVYLEAIGKVDRHQNPFLDDVLSHGTDFVKKIYESISRANDCYTRNLLIADMQRPH